MKAISLWKVGSGFMGREGRGRIQRRNLARQRKRDKNGFIKPNCQEGQQLPKVSNVNGAQVAEIQEGKQNNGTWAKWVENGAYG